MSTKPETQDTKLKRHSIARHWGCPEEGFFITLFADSVRKPNLNARKQAGVLCDGCGALYWQAWFIEKKVQRVKDRLEGDK